MTAARNSKSDAVVVEVIQMLGCVPLVDHGGTPTDGKLLSVILNIATDPAVSD